MKKRSLKDTTTTGYQAEVACNSFAWALQPRPRATPYNITQWMACGAVALRFTHRDHPVQSSLHHRRPKPGDIAMKTDMDQLPRVVPANFH